MATLIDTVARRLVRRGLRRGLIEGNVAWLAVGAAAGLVRLLAHKEPPKVSTEDLKMGETVIVTHLAPPDRPPRGRKPAAQQGGSK